MCIIAAVIGGGTIWLGLTGHYIALVGFPVIYALLTWVDPIYEKHKINNHAQRIHGSIQNDNNGILLRNFVALYRYYDAWPPDELELLMHLLISKNYDVNIESMILILQAECLEYDYDALCGRLVESDADTLDDLICAYIDTYDVSYDGHMITHLERYLNDNKNQYTSGTSHIYIRDKVERQREHTVLSDYESRIRSASGPSRSLGSTQV